MADRMTDKEISAPVFRAALALNRAIAEVTEAGLRVDLGVYRHGSFGQRFEVPVVTVAVYREVQGDDAG